MKKMNKKGMTKGFTLTELVIVIVIIAILAAVLIPSMTGYVKRAKKSNAQSEAASVYTIYTAWLADTEDNGGAEGVTVPDGQVAKAATYTQCADGEAYSSSTQYYTLSNSVYSEVTVNKATFEANETSYYTLATAAVEYKPSYTQSFAQYYADAQIVDITEAATTVNSIEFVTVTLTSFVMNSSNDFQVKCDISSGSPVYTVADEANTDLK